ncbi:hypothetical protein [Allokutzneria albata]|uniref:Uncharacterized protein n=1 Tax=Allokutzneria albata TaxID=211114 RepID=A0A1H0CLI6_ALLAB|nr:hypothetical protein [Allokutzneria albata]SDN58747.1 hypothetical protein SAMN04489726_7297 [Allokutzneria albata]
MAVHVSLVADEFSKAALMLLSEGRPLLSVTDARTAVTFGVGDAPQSPVELVMFARELRQVAAQFADQAERYAQAKAHQGLAVPPQGLIVPERRGPG